MVDILCRLDPVRKLEAGLEHLPGVRLKSRPLDGAVDSPSAPVVVKLVHPHLREVPGSRPRRPRGRGRHAGGARARPQGRSCLSAAWGCVASACRRRWRDRASGGRCRHRTAGLPRRPSRRSRLLGESAKSSCMTMSPSSKRGMVCMSGVGSNKISAAVFVLSQNLLLW